MPPADEIRPALAMTPSRLLLAAALLAAAGCGERFGTVPVVGRVTVAGGPPPAAGYLFFVPDRQGPPAADGSGPRSGSARWAADGTFAAGTFRAADGLRPGSYRVRIECDLGGDRPGGDAEGRPPEERPAIPAGFRPPVLVVPASGPQPVRYDIELSTPERATAVPERPEPDSVGPAPSLGFPIA